MMDSQEKALKEGILEGTAVENAANNACAEPKEEAKAEVKPVEEANTVAEATEDAITKNEEADKSDKDLYKTKAEVLDRVKELAHGDGPLPKDEIDNLKTVFYKLHIAQKDAKYKEYIDAGGDPEHYQIIPDDDEEAFKAEMTIIKEKRAKIFAEQEAEKEGNYNKKFEIIEKIKSMVSSPEEANKSYNDFKQLQQEWKEIKAIPASKANELWRNYQLYVEQFYDLLKLNIEAREYDFKKNLEIKTHLCEAAEKLANDDDIISAFHQLQKLHQEYRETGPVSKDLREEVWNRFKAASTIINKRHQQHFEELRLKEEDNLVKKTALCEKIEAIAKEENKGASDWEKHTKEIIEIQTEWKTIGFAPQKMNIKIFDRFRATCDDFFGRKAEFFKTLKEKFSENASKKKELVEKAKALKDSVDWKNTSDELIKLQKEWKTIGMVPKKLGDQLWSEFLDACNHFFDARNSANAGLRNEEHENLEKKRNIIEELKGLAEQVGDNAQEAVQKLTEEYNSIGHVPFKEKDVIYKEYHDILDTLYNKLNIKVAKRKFNNFKNNLKNVAAKGIDALDNERGRLLRQYDSVKSEVQTYENNLGFLNSTSKKGNNLIEEMNRKVQKLKDEMELIKQKIKAIDAQNKEE
ncbi:protein of unknown function DUF349 [Xylanibacter oryzae DSM 17970]|uniref:DUF349 domain-containing protein n=1 Tax=Xylanibacter oryzae DSM 17970 TaxID=915438 RepID=A0ABN0RU57_9BACT|nr:DUF349 domain-containing protein [Xylanibacter oryzae]EXG77755.1 protein of unknown function DUF349 [Xylanibacter oryzae DSM 17970]